MRETRGARRTLCSAVGVALAALLGARGVAQGACMVAQIIAAEPGCQNATGTCTINGTHTVENGCTLDFGARDVRWDGLLTAGSHMATLRAHSLSLLVHARFDGTGTAIGASGGMLVIETAGDFAIAQSGTQSGQIDVSGNNVGGQVIIRAGGTATLNGRLQADGLTGAAAGGLIAVTAAGDITAGPASVISAHGGIDSEGGGEIDLIAGGALTLQSDLDVSGLDGGFLELQAGGVLTMQGADAAGRGDAGSGGCVDVTGGRGTELKGNIDATGATGSFMTGGCGGLICFDGGLGDVKIDAGATIDADGASPDGGGGQIALISRGNTNITGSITARGPTGETCGGDICVETGYDVTLFAGGSIDVSGGDSGGELDLLAARNMTISGAIGASGRQSGSLGGDVSLRAGDNVRGALVVANTVDVRSDSACSIQNGCGLGGTTDLSGCNVTINAAGALLAGGPDAGENDIASRDQLTVRGVVDAIATVATGAVGFNRFVHRTGHAPFVQGTGIKPTAIDVAVSTCPDHGPTEPACLTPCPTCGNGVVEFPETCDLGVVPPVSCGGCSIYCQTEQCDDGLVCTGDSCDPTFGCVNQPTPGCNEPTATVTGTPPTATATRTASATPSASAVPTGTSTPIPTASATPAATASVTATAASTSTATATTSLTPTASPTTTATGTVTATASARDTDTPLPEPTGTRAPLCTGDCDGSRSVTVSELILGVNIALGSADVAACTAFDSDGDGRVSISELIAAVGAALAGC